MGWSVGFDLGFERFRGYGVPAYCDAYFNGCRSEIDRGLGFLAEGATGEDSLSLSGHALFSCGCSSVEDLDADSLPPEHPKWVEHVSTDYSWGVWRQENPELLKRWVEGDSVRT